MSLSTTNDTWIVTAETDGGQRLTVELQPGKNLFVGASNHCGLQLSGSDISSLQCLIMLDQGTVSVQDWASKAGTFVNGQAIHTKTELAIDDVVCVGEYQIRVQPRSTVAATSWPSSVSASSSSASPTPLLRATSGPPTTISGTLLPASESIAKLTLATATQPSETRDKLGQEPVAAESPSAEPLFKETPPTNVAATNVAATNVAATNVAATNVGGTEVPSTEPLSREAVASEAVEIVPKSSVLDPDEPVAVESPALESVALESVAHDSFTFDDNLFEADSFDQETVQLLRAELEDLQAAVAQRDEQIAMLLVDQEVEPPQHEADELEHQTETMLRRLQDLLDEAECYDERVALLEELLQTAEAANQAEHEERSQLEAWVGDIERRIGQREEEWKAETDALRQQVDQARGERDRVQHQLRDAATQGSAPAAYQETLERLQQQNDELQQALDANSKEIVTLQQRLERSEQHEEDPLRDERAEIARERAEISRLRHELQRQLSNFESLPSAKAQPDREFADRLKTLREHLKEIHQEEKLEREQSGSTLTSRISQLWKRLEY